MRIDFTEDRIPRVREVYSGLLLETEEGNGLGVCMRDDTFEIHVIPADRDKGLWFRVDMQEMTVNLMDESARLRPRWSGGAR